MSDDRSTPGVDVRNSRWFIEFTTPHEAHMHGIKKFLVTSESKFQTMEVAQTYAYGKCLMLDGKMQSSEKDEFIYHEALVHPAMITHPDPKRVAIIGGGEGATLREVLKHKSVKEGVQIDIDEDVMKMSEKYLPEWNAGCFKDKRARMLTADGRKFLADAKDSTYDIIVLDLSEPVPGGPSYLLFTKEFYEIVSQKLTPNGVVSLQAATTANADLALHAMIMRTLRTVFPITRSFSIECPSFDLPWSIGIASKKFDPMKLSPGEVDKRIKSRGLGTLGYYDGITHLGIFNTPKYMREALAKKGDIIEDNHPMFTAI